MRQVAVDLLHACALARDGIPYCWGGDDGGRFTISTLGKGLRIQDSAQASNADAFRFEQIDVGNSLFCGVTQPEGAIQCWGDLLAGQPRDSSDYPSCADAPVTCEAERQSRVVPEAIERWGNPWSVRFVHVSAGSSLGCGIDTKANAYCWGSNYRCALGRCRSPDSFRAHRIPISGRVVEVEPGYWFACARTADGRVFCWGDNRVGQLGSLTTVNAGADGLPPDYRDSTTRVSSAAHDDPCFLGGRCSPAPVEVSPGRHWAALAVGSSHACALSADDGGVYCWGGGDDGDGALGGAAPLTLCMNRSANWKDERCQPTPVRVAGLPSLAPPRDTIDDRARRPRVQVRVSRREVRSEFHTDTTGGWGWTGSRDNNYVGRYDWSVSVPGMDGPQSLMVFLERSGGVAREFGSLSDVVRAARVTQCSPGMLGDCTVAGMSATVAGDAVVLVMRDSARIARLFGMRPPFVRAWEVRPERRESWSDSIRVEYAEPRIPEPDENTRADAKRSLRRYEQSITHISRFIDAPGEHGRRLRLSVGDSVAVFVNESYCHYDSCYVGSLTPPTDSGWSVDDQRIARLQAHDDRTKSDNLLGVYGSRYYLKALRPGRTAIRVHGVHGPSDTAASSQPPGRELESDVVVTLPLRRLEITPRPQTVLLNQPLILSAIVRDTADQPVGDVNVMFAVEGLGYQIGTTSLTPTTIELRGRGRKRIVASAGSLRDTLFVTVVDSAGRR